MALVFCRHGQTYFNLEDKFQGIIDSPLTKEGIAQAKRVNEFLRDNFDVKKFFISPAGRVRQTYEIISKNIEATLKILPELREVCYGEWEGIPRKSINPKLLEEREKNRFTYKHPGSYKNILGESYSDVYKRVSLFLKKIENEVEDICIITHNGVLISVVKYFNNLTNEESNKIRVSNDEVIVVKKVGRTHVVTINQV